MKTDNRHRIAYYAIAAFALVAGWAMAGCNNAELNFYRSLAVTSQGVASAYTLLDKYDDGKVSTILAIPDRDKARAELAAYEKQLVVARRVLATAADACDATNGANKLYQDVAAKKWAQGMVDLLEIAAPVVDSLKQFGIKVPL